MKGIVQASGTKMPTYELYSAFHEIDKILLKIYFVTLQKHWPVSNYTIDSTIRAANMSFACAVTSAAFGSGVMTLQERSS